MVGDRSKAPFSEQKRSPSHYQNKIFPKVKRAFQEMSYGKFDIDVTVVPEVIRYQKQRSRYTVGGFPFPGLYNGAKESLDANSKWGSRYSFDDYDLAYVISPQQAPTGTKGVAWVGAKGAMCNGCEEISENFQIMVAVHELGHALGMNHEQQRPDASKQYYTPAGWKGPYLQIHWDGIDPSWKPQYVPSDSDYIGSSQRGYAEYDFESIMHYPEDGKNFNTMNPIFDKVVGNRDHLSAGDIQRASDMYQCGGSPGPSPPPAPTPAPPSPTPTGCVDQPYSPQQCAGWKGAGYCSAQSKEYGFMKDHCPRTCGFCGSPSPPPAPCVDQPYGSQKCAGWKGMGYCSPQSTEYGFMKDHCPKACGFCGRSSIVV